MLWGLLSTKRGEADRVIANLAERLSAGGFRLAGLVQSNIERPGRCRCDMILKDLASGRELPISQNLGDGARGCRLDHGALETAVGWVEASIVASVDVVLLNKFGKREAEGAGLRPAIAAAVALDIPVIAGLAPENREAWDVFCGSEGRICAIDSVDAILASLLRQRSPRSSWIMGEKTSA
jgi:nucleoside-triphosphatase THEP1